MKVADIRKMRNRTPFRPFQIHLTTGEILPVSHPEQMSIPNDETQLFVIWTNRDWNLLEAAQVAQLSVRRRAPK